MIDTRSILLAYAPVLASAAILLLFTWQSIGRPAFLAAWSAACLCAAVASAIFSARAILPGPFVILAANPVWFTGWALLLKGARDLRGMRAPLPLVLLPAGVWLTATLLPGFYESLELRLGLALIIALPMAAATALALLNHRHQGRRSRGATLFACLVSGYIATQLTLVVVGQSPSWAGVATLLVGTEFICLAFSGLVIAHEHAAALDAALLTAAQLREAALRTELARREAMSIRAVYAEFERLLGGLPIGIFLRKVEPDGAHRVIFAGGDIEMATGWPSDVVSSPEALGALREPDAPTRQTIMLRALQEGSVHEDWRLRQPDGSWRWIRSHARCLSRRPDGGGEVAGYFQDISRERAAQAQAERAGRLASLGEMASGMAHELRQPLTIISFATQNAVADIARDDLGRLAQRLDRIAEQTARANNIIEHLRMFARGADEGVKPVPVGLDRVVEGSLTLVGEPLRLADIAVSTAVGEPVLRVMGEQMLLEQVLMNLLLNARDALTGRPAGEKRRIHIAATIDPDTTRIHLTVADNGGGIASHVLPLMFQPFVTTKLASKGTGLGLSICHGIVRSLGGDITVANGAEGAVFTIALDAAPREAG